jgi:ATP/maltotriose-dependent transcriptional regulator MalT/DNA-binding SARP family transcriptional activator
MSEHSGTRILSSKLTTPHVADTIPRERLLFLLNGVKEKRLTAVVAGAGYGKTTLMAQAASSWEAKTIWYRLDESDSDLVAFIAYLIAGVRKHYPDFGAATIGRLREADHSKNGLRHITRTFLGEMEDTLREHTVIVLDDYHLVNGSREIGEALEMILRDLSPLAHLALISRAEPALPLARLRAMREVMDISEADLAFPAVEIDRLCAEIFGFSLDPTRIDAIRQRMEGWISGLILLFHSLKGKHAAEIETGIMNLRGSRMAIFRYLEENLYGALSEETQDFLVKTSILPRMNARFCDRLLNVSSSLDILKYLEANHLFTSSDEDGCYCYHQLFRDFLLNRLEEVLERERVVELHRNAANLLERNGEAEDALRHYLAAEEIERACNVLDCLGRNLFAEGRFQLLSSFLGCVPEELMGKHPWLEYLRGQLDGLNGKHREAVRRYERAHPNFHEQGNEEGALSCLVESGLLLFQTGRLKEAQERFQELLDQTNVDPRLRIEVLGYLTYISAYLGNMGLAERCFGDAMELVNGLGNEELRRECLAWVYCYRGFHLSFSGDYAGVLETAEYLKTFSHASGPYRHPLTSHLLESVGCFGLRLYSRGYEAAKEGLRILGEQSPQGDTPVSDWHAPRLSLRGERGFPDSLTPWLFACAAQNAAGLGKAAEALEDAGESLRLFRKMGIRYGEAYVCCILSRTHMESGKGVAAEQWARSGIEAIRGLGWTRTERMLKLNLAGALVEKGDLEESLRFLKDVEPFVKDPLTAAWMSLVFARIDFAQARTENGLQRLVSSLELCRQHGFESLLDSEAQWIIPPLLGVFSRGKMQPYIQEIIGRMGPDGAGQLAALQDESDPGLRKAASDLMGGLPRATPPGLRIQMLGKFRVFVGEEELPGDRWKSRKARTLFQFLVYSRPRGYLNKELLMELLWPEEDPAITVKRLHVALVSLRKTLEPGIVKGSQSSYISRAGDSYKVDIGEGGSDVEAFSERLKHAGMESNPDQSLAHLLSAESLYGGDFMEEEPYSEWCVQPREKLREDYLRVVRRIVDHYEQQGNHARCIELAEKYLTVDSFAEPIYRSLMISYWKIGDRFRMARTYERCRDSVIRELNCGLSEETELLYRELMKNQHATVP